MSRQRAAELELSENELVIARDELDALHDDLYVLACAVGDAEADVEAAGSRPSVRELQLVIDDLLAAAKPLRDRELSAPSVPPLKRHDGIGPQEESDGEAERSETAGTEKRIPSRSVRAGLVAPRRPHRAADCRRSQRGT